MTLFSAWYAWLPVVLPLHATWLLAAGLPRMRKSNFAPSVLFFELVNPTGSALGVLFITLKVLYDARRNGLVRGWGAAYLIAIALLLVVAFAEGVDRGIDPPQQGEIARRVVLFTIIVLGTCVGPWFAMAMGVGGG
jgi:uncharacterized membrane protein (DUF441 family)